MTRFARRIKPVAVRKGIQVWRVTLHAQWQCECGAQYLDDCRCIPPALHEREIEGHSFNWVADEADRWQDHVEKSNAQTAQKVG